MSPLVQRKLIQILVLSIPFCLAVQYEDEEFEFDLSMLGEGLYEPRNGNHTQKRLDQSVDSEAEDSNPEEAGNYVEGDIYQPLVAKNAIKFKSKKWKKGIVPYEISDEFSSSEAQKIRSAFQIFRQRTCVRFVPRENQPDYISIESSVDGCWSTVGRAGGKQVLNLQRNVCIRRTGTIMHELMHVLGFFHEHTRHDRDQYVKVKVQNIKPDSLGNFRKDRQERTTTHGISYDLGSVMHYSPTAFSWNGAPTIEPKFAGLSGFIPVHISSVHNSATQVLRRHSIYYSEDESKCIIFNTLLN
ncbi:hatching enzyme 1.2-like [Topomyia yanbarensis]|uniref:hatching enzyme 1.2-like n=1 Tax=Topomyia yanbarensis TaxID=2498891 RepID=UPI00273C421A|nr:hatching enzyme 1.2-like [Topomyia yanbarensis]